ncbi:putative glucose-6-phosphate 1-epimerase-like protein [Fimicolochytrium jonesii]|uniref:putative glucose-6-phosphate 1-epimerase-like protein n=1 Tax=Fimicolochytrium jonesii TaxID=1396493 RepID=UPI0022FE35E7|nr:putative glucose-6-phosphate 1-epimerase-like protein [Fimicolochytrium jonesii]KAI8819479.1 putative glucose-6-phosphate 1-epimerase-like protein [Fimicolochytrium jonesii]
MPVDTSNPTKVILTHNTSTAEIYYFGATLTSWKPHGTERLFLSSKAILDGSKAIRGGIPIVFPHFGTIPSSKLPQHGFARNSLWKLDGIPSESTTETTVTLSLSPDSVPPNLRELWPHAFHLAYTVTLTDGELKTALGITNPSPAAWDFTTLLHTYLRVGDIAPVRVAGLHGVPFVDKVAAEGEEATAVEGREAVSVAREVDRVYGPVQNDELVVKGTGVGDGTVFVHKQNFPDVVVWNPWIEKAKGMADFADDEYHNMICVEVGHVSTPVTLAPGQTWQGSQTLGARKGAAL